MRPTGLDRKITDIKPSLRRTGVSGDRGREGEKSRLRKKENRLDLSALSIRYTRGRLISCAAGMDWSVF